MPSRNSQWCGCCWGICGWLVDLRSTDPHTRGSLRRLATALGLRSDAADFDQAETDCERVESRATVEARTIRSSVLGAWSSKCRPATFSSGSGSSSTWLYLRFNDGSPQQKSPPALDSIIIHPPAVAVLIGPPRAVQSSRTFVDLTSLLSALDLQLLPTISKHVSSILPIYLFNWKRSELSYIRQERCWRLVNTT